MLYETRFLIALVFTILIEVPILFLLVRYVFDKDRAINNLRIIAAGTFAQMLSLPYLWFVLPQCIDSRYYLHVGEIIVVFIEAIFLNQMLGLSIKNAFIASFITNLASFTLGLLIFRSLF